MAKQYEEICDFYMIASSDEIRKKSDKFFKFFTDFIDEVQKSIPKPVKAPTKKAPSAAADTKKTAQKSA